jgi:DNA-directed RNA polymerase specialized sigma24 family protein
MTQRREDNLNEEPDAIRYTNDYVRRLLAERHHIRAKVLNPGGSIILGFSGITDLERLDDYSSQVGNSFHLDLIEVEDQLSELPKVQVETLKAYMDGMTSDQAAHLLTVRGGVTIRSRRRRAVQRLARKMNDQRTGDAADAGRGGNGPTPTERQEK